MTALQTLLNRVVVTIRCDLEFARYVTESSNVGFGGMSLKEHSQDLSPLARLLNAYFPLRCIYPRVSGNEMGLHHRPMQIYSLTF